MVLRESVHLPLHWFLTNFRRSLLCVNLSTNPSAESIIYYENNNMKLNIVLVLGTLASPSCVIGRTETGHFKGGDNEQNQSNGNMNFVKGKWYDADEHMDSSSPDCIKADVPFEAGFGFCETYAEATGDFTDSNYLFCSEDQAIISTDGAEILAEDTCAECGKCLDTGEACSTPHCFDILSGSLYVNPHLGPGFASYHFDAIDDSYLSYENAPAFMLLDDWSSMPSAKEFEGAVFNEATRTFTATVTWPVPHPSHIPFVSVGKEEYTMIFSEDFSEISGGHMDAFDADGTELYSFDYGNFLVYQRLDV